MSTTLRPRARAAVGDQAKAQVCDADRHSARLQSRYDVGPADRVERIDKCDAETPRPPRRLRGHFAGDAVDADRRGGRHERVGRAAANAATIPDSAQPSAVTFDISGEPLAISTTRSPSVTRSTAPVAATTQAWWRASAIAEARAASVPCALSTPLGAAASSCSPAMRAQAMISEALPRTIVGFSASRRRVVSSRKRVAPTPTGSSTQGRPFFPGDPRRRLHADDPIGRQRADVDDQRVGDGAEVLGLLRRVDHRRRSADRQQRIGGDVHRDIIGHRLDERPLGAQRGQAARGFSGERDRGGILRAHGDRLPGGGAPTADP